MRWLIWLSANQAGLAVGIVGIILTLLFDLTGLYSFLHEDRPAISVTVTSSLSVLDRLVDAGVVEKSGDTVEIDMDLLNLTRAILGRSG